MNGIITSDGRLIRDLAQCAGKTLLDLTLKHNLTGSTSPSCKNLNNISFKMKRSKTTNLQYSKTRARKLDV